MSAPQINVWKLQGDVKVLWAKIMAADNSRGSFAARHNVCREAGISGTAPSMLQLSGIKKNVITNKVNYLFGKSDNSTTHPIKAQKRRQQSSIVNINMEANFLTPEISVKIST